MMTARPFLRRTSVRLLLVAVAGALTLAAFLMHKRAPTPVNNAQLRTDRVQAGRELLRTLGIRTVGVQIEGPDSTVVYLLDTAESHLDSLFRWDRWEHLESISIPTPNPSADFTPFARLVESLGWHDVRVIAMIPSYVEHHSDGRRVNGPIVPFEWFGSHCDRTRGIVLQALYRGTWEIDDLIDPGQWQEIDRRKAGLHSWPERPLEESQLDTVLARWIGQKEHGSLSGIPDGASLSGRTLILDTSFPRPWRIGLHVGDSLNLVRKVLGKESFLQDSLVVYKAHGFHLALASDGLVLISATPVLDPTELLGRLLLALRRRVSIDTIPFFDKVDTLADSTIDYQGPFGLRVLRHASKDSIDLLVHNEFTGRLASPTPVRRQVWLRYRNVDRSVERMSEDLKAWRNGIKDQAGEVSDPGINLR